jgi:monoamine oxidase
MAALAQRLGLGIHDQWATGDGLVALKGKVQRVNGFNIPPAYRFSGGAQTLIDGLADQLVAGSVVLDCEVARVEPVEGGVTVHLPTGPVGALAAVLALPPSLAMSLGIVAQTDLEPAVAEVATTIPVWMGATTKAVAVYPEPFWRTAGLSGTISALDGPFREIHDMCGPEGTPAALFGFGQSTPGGPSVSATAFVEQLTELFGAVAGTPLEATAVDWSTEHFTTPSGRPPSMRYELFGSPLLRRPSWDGRLHWTSTETASVAPGHLEGALAAAERTAEALETQRSHPT